MAPTNVNTVRQTSLLHVEATPINSDYSRPVLSATKRTNHAPISFWINKPKFLKASHHAEMRKTILPESMAIQALNWSSRCASHHPAVQSPVHLWKMHNESCPFPAPCWLSQDENRPWSKISSLPETSRFARIFLHKGSALPWLVDDRAALRPRGI